MLARVKQDYRWKTVNAFTGHEYVKYEWRNVPAGMEEQAKKHPDLEVKDGSIKELDEETVQPVKAEQKEYPQGGMPDVKSALPEAQSRKPSRRSKKELSDSESEEE